MYQIIDNLRKELKGDIAAMGQGLSTQIGRVDAHLSDLEGGRLSSVESDVTNIKIRQATAGVKLAVMGFIGSTIAGSAISVIIAKALT